MYFYPYFRHLNAFIFLYQKIRMALYDLVFSMFRTCKTNRTFNCFTRKKYFFNSNNVEKQLSIYFFQTFTIPLSWIFNFLQIIKISKKKNLFVQYWLKYFQVTTWILFPKYINDKNYPLLMLAVLKGESRCLWTSVWYHTVNYLHRGQMCLKTADFGNLLWLLIAMCIPGCFWCRIFVLDI